MKNGEQFIYWLTLKRKQRKVTRKRLVTGVTGRKIFLKKQKRQYEHKRYKKPSLI